MTQIIPPVFEDFGTYLRAKELFYFLFGEFCSIFTYHGYEFDPKVIDILKDTYGKNPEFRLYFDHDTFKNNEVKDKTTYLLVLKKNWIIIYVDKTIAIYFNSNEDYSELEEIKKLIFRFIINKNEVSSYYVIVNSPHSEFAFMLKESTVRNYPVDINVHYNDSFYPVHQKIESFFDEDASGLIILHGKQGTGKTSYIMHLINHTQNRIIYLPVEMVNIISNPTFLPFIMNYKNSILVIEDCEDLLQARNSTNKMNHGLVNILNMSYGLLGDSLKLKLICTFNAPLTNIDKALLRKGRLVAIYEFRKLETEKVNSIIKHENMNIPLTTVPMTLAELFYYHEEGYKPVENKTIGFNLKKDE